MYTFAHFSHKRHLGFRYSVLQKLSSQWFTQVGIDDSPNIVVFEYDDLLDTPSEVLRFLKESSLKENRPITMVVTSESVVSDVSIRRNANIWELPDVGISIPWGSLTDLRVYQRGDRVNGMVDRDLNFYNSDDVVNCLIHMLTMQKTHGAFGGEIRPTISVPELTSAKTQLATNVTYRQGDKFYASVLDFSSTDLVEVEADEHKYQFFGDRTHRSTSTHIKLLKYFTNSTCIMQREIPHSLGYGYGWCKPSDGVRLTRLTTCDDFDLYYDIVDAVRLPHPHVPIATVNAGYLVLTDDIRKGTKILQKYTV